MIGIIKSVKLLIDSYRKNKEYWDEEISYLIKDEYSKIRYTNTQKEKIYDRLKESLSLGNENGCKEE